jgi:hypothetical protein
MPHSTNHILTSHVGSLIWPPDLLALIDPGLRLLTDNLGDRMALGLDQYSIIDWAAILPHLDIVSDGEF